MENPSRKKPLVDVLHPEVGRAERGKESIMARRTSETVDEDPIPRPRGSQLVVSNNTLVPISVLVAIVLAIVAGDRRFSGIENNQINGQKMMTDLSSKLDGTWGTDDMRWWAMQLKNQNPNLVVPDPAKLKATKP